MVVWHESHKTVPGNSESGPCTHRIPHSGEFAVFIVFLSPQLGCSTRPFYGRNSIDFRCGEPYRWSQSAVRASYPQEVCRVHGRARFNPSIPTVDPKGVSGRDWPQSFRVQTNLRLEKTTPFDPQDFS